MTVSNTAVSPIGENLRANWKRWIMMRLGAPVVKVELAESMVDEAIDSAIKNFAQWTDEFDEVCIFQVTGAVAEYDLREMIPEYLMVKDVLYSPSQAGSLLQGFFTDFSFDNRQFFWYHSTYASMTDYYILNMYNEMYLRTIGNEGQWDIVGHRLFLSPTPDKAVWAAIRYVAFPGDNDFRRDEWVREWALSECMYMLAAIRGKYSQIPGPTSGGVQMNADKLEARATEMQKDLLLRRNEYTAPAFVEVG